jgi:Flp pilus assembly protein TadG
MRMLARFLRGESGGAMAEFALVATFLFFPLLFGFVELGRMVFTKTTITAAAREGARYAIVRGSESDSPPSDTTAARVALANYVANRTPLAGINVDAKWQTAQMKWKDWVEVKVTFSYVPLIPFLNPRTITSTSRQIIQW